MLVQQQAHQLGNGDGGVGVIELETVARGESGEILAIRHDPARQHILQAGRCQEILLSQAQDLALLTGIIGIQNHGDLFRLVLGGHRIRIAAGIELV